MKNVVGNPARGDNFFRRDKEVFKIVDRISNGNNLQIAAPRRVGKTSILFYLLDNLIEGYIYVYIDTESIDNQQDFYKKLLKELLKIDAISKSSLLNKALREGKKFLKSIKSIKPLEGGLEFHEVETNYTEEIFNFLAGTELDDGKKLILLIDEFPQTIQNIVNKQGEKTDEAIQFLQSNRELRQSPEINTKIHFIYTGSIGLNHTVASINATAFVNDLNSVEIDSLTKDEAKEFLNTLLVAKNITIEDDVANYLLNKIEWLIPFHIQLIVQELFYLVSKSKIITIELVETAFGKIIDARNNNHFDHYYSRLKSQFKGDEFKFADELLQNLAVNVTITRNDIYDLAAKYNIQKKCRLVIEILVYDGYINNIGDPATYRFNSPIVRMWWNRFICK